MADDPRRPAGVDDATVAAAGKISEALEYVHRIRGALYEVHQLMGRADYLFEDGASMLRDAGHDELAELVECDVVGRNVLAGRWTFQVVEEFDATYYDRVLTVEKRVRDQLLDGARHVLESEMKESRRTHGRDGHESRPADA